MRIYEKHKISYLVEQSFIESEFFFSDMYDPRFDITHLLEQYEIESNKLRDVHNENKNEQLDVQYNTILLKLNEKYRCFHKFDLTRAILL